MLLGNVDVPLDRVKAALCKTDYSFYLEVVNHFKYIHSAHTKLICQKLEEIESGKIKRLLVCMPPRHSKSMSISEAFPSWYLSKDPDSRKCILLSYGQKLPTKFGRSNKSKIIEFGREIFNVCLPPYQLKQESANNFGIWKIDPETGEPTATPCQMLSVGIKGSFEGEGATLLIIDDPVKNVEVASSQTQMDSIFDEFQSTVMGRLQPNASMIVVATRWSEQDFVGRLLEADKEGKWVQLILPAVYEERIDVRTGKVIPDPVGRQFGDTLFPEIGFDKKWAEETKKEVTTKEGLKNWESRWQQRPTVASGTIIKRDWLKGKYYTTLPESFDTKIISWDLAAKDKVSSSYSAMTVWGKTKTGYYLIDAWRGKLLFPALLQMVKSQFYKNNQPEEPVSAVLIEDKSSGEAVIPLLRDDSDIPVIAIKATISKEMRLNSVSPLFESGHIYLPENKSWTLDYCEELFNFPYGKAADWVDSSSQALEYLRTKSGQNYISFLGVPDAEDLMEGKQRIEVDEGDGEKSYIYIEKDGPSEPDKPLYTSIEDKDFYIDLARASKDQLLLNFRESDMVPKRCIRFGPVLRQLLSELKPVCFDCNADRSICRGKEKGEK